MNDRYRAEVSEMRAALAGWLSDVPSRCWSDDRFGGTIYGSGYAAWGIWAQINLTFVLASSFSWAPAEEERIRGPLGTRAGRRQLLDNLIAYIVGSHVTGSFETVGGGSWGSRAQSASEPEHFENWHSPIWVTTLAQAAMRSEGVLNDRLRAAVDGIVAHDARVQASLPIAFLDGRADSRERHGFFTSIGEKNSHPESNAWKAALVSLARYAASTPEDAQDLSEFERIAWLSSSASPSDLHSGERWTDGTALADHQVGTHISDSGAVIHHGILHPGYAVFALFSRMQTYEFAANHDKPYPAEAERREELLFSIVRMLIVSGRLIHPSGEDWPRWVYGQCYLAPVLAHHQRKYRTDLHGVLKPAIEVLLRETRERPSRLLGSRFADLESHHRWHYDRYETDLAYALALTAEIVEQDADGAQNHPPPPVAYFYDPLAETAVVRTDETLISLSTRTWSAEFQVIIAKAPTTDFIEWDRSGTYRISVQNLPDLGRDTSTLESLAATEDGGFRAAVRTDIGISPQTRCVLRLDSLVRAFPEIETVLIVHTLSVVRHTQVDAIEMHLWKFAHGQSGREELHFADDHRRCTIDPGAESRHEDFGNWVRLDNRLTLVVPSSTDLGWALTRHRSMTDPSTAVAWTEICLPIAVQRDVRVTPGSVLCEIPVLATYARGITDFACSGNSLFALDREFKI